MQEVYQTLNYRAVNSLPPFSSLEARRRLRYMYDAKNNVTAKDVSLQLRDQPLSDELSGEQI